jgi:small subunit ribosomal protein S9
MADERSPDVPEETPQDPQDQEPQAEAPEQEPQAEAPEQEPPQHAVPGEDAREIAGSAEDAALEAAEEAQESGAGLQTPEQEAVSPAGDGHAVPTGEAQEIAGSAEDAALESRQEADEDEQEPAPREKPAVPGAHLEVDIVPEGVDPLGRGEEYADMYAAEGEDGETGGQPVAEQGEEDQELAQPIATAAIDLASGARYRATGKRKTAIARVMLRPGSGTYVINGRPLEQHFPRLTLQRNIRQPLETVGYQDRMDVVARLHGGGISAQAGALRHGVSRALLEADPNLRGELKRRGFLTRDSRAKERKKAGLKKARKRPQFSKR